MYTSEERTAILDKVAADQATYDELIQTARKLRIIFDEIYDIPEKKLFPIPLTHAEIEALLIITEIARRP
jgi:hypothetical protein